MQYFYMKVSYDEPVYIYLHALIFPMRMRYLRNALAYYTARRAAPRRFVVLANILSFIFVTLRSTQDDDDEW